jgi:hypothetical protein
LLFDPGGIHQRLQRFHTGLVMERARQKFGGHFMFL